MAVRDPKLRQPPVSSEAPTGDQVRGSSMPSQPLPHNTVVERPTAETLDLIGATSLAPPRAESQKFGRLQRTLSQEDFAKPQPTTATGTQILGWEALQTEALDEARKLGPPGHIVEALEVRGLATDFMADPPSSGDTVLMLGPQTHKEIERVSPGNEPFEGRRGGDWAVISSSPEDVHRGWPKDGHSAGGWSAKHAITVQCKSCTGDSFQDQLISANGQFVDVGPKVRKSQGGAERRETPLPGSVHAAVIVVRDREKKLQGGAGTMAEGLLKTLQGADLGNLHRVRIRLADKTYYFSQQAVPKKAGGPTKKSKRFVPLQFGKPEWVLIAAEDQPGQLLELNQEVVRRKGQLARTHAAPPRVAWQEATRRASPKSFGSRAAPAPVKATAARTTNAPDAEPHVRPALKVGAVFVPKIQPPPAAPSELHDRPPETHWTPRVGSEGDDPRALPKSRDGIVSPHPVAPSDGFAPRYAGAPTQQGAYVPQQGPYGPPQGPYVPQQGAYGPPQGPYVPPQGAYGPPQGSYVAQPMFYAEQQGPYAPQPMFFPEQQGGYGTPSAGHQGYGASAPYVAVSGPYAAPVVVTDPYTGQPMFMVFGPME